MVAPLFCNINKRATFYRNISSLFNVCTYFIVEEDKLIIIDPGKFEDDVFEWINKYKTINKFVYISHEHFDHHYHANRIFELEKTYFFSPSENFNNALKDTRKNLSYFYDDPTETKPNLITSDPYLKIIKTPGHSVESYCFIYDNVIFGGDTIIEKKYLVFKLPGGNKNDFIKSVENINEIIDSNTIVLPGHGDLFCYNEWTI
jgi:hydroxyacylglutathione hydrolase